MKNLFNSIKLTRPKKSSFDLTHDVKMSLDMGDLVPIMCMEAVPGDKFHISCDSLLRFSPLVSPVMHRFDVTMHYFFVPNRILWGGWEKWIVNDPGADLHPTYRVREDSYTPLLGYLGVPTPPPMATPGFAPTHMSALPILAYNAIYQEYYRDQNLISAIPYFQQGGGDLTASIIMDNMHQMKKRAWEHDYFTSALPWAQKGDAVTLPLGELDDVPVKYANPSITTTRTLTGTPANVTVDGADTDAMVPNNSLFAQTSEATIGSATINDLRRAFRLQEWLEKNARGGTRYIENILSHFGVRSSDKRLQRPEYITGTKSPVVISEVLNTTGEDGGLPQGNMAGHGVSVTTGKYGSYFCEEHGFIMGIMSVMPKTAYQQGMPRAFTKFTDPFEYYWPSFAHIGEQEVKMKELFAYTSSNDSTFGYVPRYAEYKFASSRVAGDFRDTLDFWHMGRIFETMPSLNKMFVECNPGKRIFAVESTENSLYAHVLNKVRAIRPMPKFGTPTF